MPCPRRPRNSGVLPGKFAQTNSSGRTLGKVPGQSEDPSCLMVNYFSTMTVFDQQVEMENASQHNAHAG
ncbi:unnamed protein product [Coregonus sp. 'balchen']|uniref:Uncharacterized protein n=1 Tax=Coregonus suidteri TaxID=861788 RepID=A0AAN8R7Z4_9TELE|nr:unnamed protein product [Coregonus sp. 'balchen']CAB1316258.1 unnamed protein product [Coregonus sp. 'balchen']